MGYIRRCGLGLGMAVVMLPMLAIILLSPHAASSSLLQATADPFATEEADHQATVPSKWDCMMPRAGILDLLSTLNNVEYAQYYDRLGTIDISQLSQGESLSDEDAAGIDWTLYQFAACANSLDPLLVIPLLSTELQAALIDNAVDAGDLDVSLDALPLLASDVIDEGGLPVANVLNAWYWDGTNKMIDAVVEVPLPQGSDVENPEFLITFIWDKSYWVIDRVWIIAS